MSQSNGYISQAMVESINHNGLKRHIRVWCDGWYVYWFIYPKLLANLKILIYHELTTDFLHAISGSHIFWKSRV